MVSLLELEETFYLSVESPSGLKWRVDKWGGRGLKIHNVVAGSDCGTQSQNGYWEVKNNNKTLKCHRIVYMLTHKVELSRNQPIDHIDGDRLNNSPNNLRVVTNTLNSRNRSIRNDSSTGLTGINVYRCDSREYIRAHWVEQGKQRYKCFSTAIYSYDEALRLAIEYRENRIAELNQQGDGYTERHGR